MTNYDIWQEETDDAEHLIAFVPGDRVISRRGEKATVVARNATTPPDCTPVVYDADDYADVWNCSTNLLRLLGEDE